MQRIFIKIFLVYHGKYLSRKAFHDWVANISLMAKKNGGIEVAEKTVKRILCCEFLCTGKAMEYMYQCWWRICREINVFSSSNNTCLTFCIRL
jgi:hypothetical protein